MAFFKDHVSTTENVAIYCWNQLHSRLPQGSLSQQLLILHQIIYKCIHFVIISYFSLSILLFGIGLLYEVRIHETENNLVIYRGEWVEDRERGDRKQEIQMRAHSGVVKTIPVASTRCQTTSSFTKGWSKTFVCWSQCDKRSFFLPHLHSTGTLMPFPSTLRQTKATHDTKNNP